jgi:hypothetical protein
MNVEKDIKLNFIETQNSYAEFNYYIYFKSNLIVVFFIKKFRRVEYGNLLQIMTKLIKFYL